MTDVCRRNPWGLRRLLRQHEGESGVVVYGWFKRYIYWPEVREWTLVDVRIAGKQQAILDEVKRRPVWLALPPGVHTLDFDGPYGRLHSETVTLAPGDRVLVAFRPPLWLPFVRHRAPRWCVRRLEPTVG